MSSSRAGRIRSIPAATFGRSYSGEELRAIAFPLGGIGTGTIGLGGRGNLQDWEIFNRPAKGWALPCTFFALWAQAADRPPVARVLERRPFPPHVRARGLRPVHEAGLPRLREAKFTGAYPIAKIEFADPELPVEVALEAFNPMIPLDEESSGLPVAIFCWELHNSSPVDVSATVAFSLANAAGHDGLTPLDDEVESIWLHPSGPCFGGNVNEWVDDGSVRGLWLSSPRTPASALGAGSLAVATSWPDTTYLEHWERAGWYDPLESFWADFRSDGRLPDLSTAEPSPDGRSDIGTLGLCAKLGPGESVVLPFVVAWHFPNLTNYWDLGSPVLGERLGTWYATRRSDAWETASEVAGRLDELTGRTRAFRDTLFSSTLPEPVLDAVSSQMSTIRTTTCLRTEDGAFHAFEGSNDHDGSCPMDCTHVWNYEQALAHLYPALERSMRETDLLASTRPSGAMAFRSLLPLSAGELWDYMPCTDGQLGTIVKLYREWRLCGDTEWLRALWPAARRALEWAWQPGSWDADGDGVMEGEQHVTYDIEFFGATTMTGTLYLGALRAAASMADALGEADVAERYRAIERRGAERLDSELWNGEYYVQRLPDEPVAAAGERPEWNPSPVHSGEREPRYQYGPGCLADQLLGQWACHVVGLGHVLPPERARSAVAAIYRHNWRESLSNHENCQRTFALDDEAGLLLCTWPHGGRPSYPFPYADEVWTGVEYQVASHLVYEGLVDEALTIVAGVRARHDGLRRNPWDEFECGHHYARALSSWSLLLALSGYRYDAVGRRLRFDPTVSRNAFECLFTTGSGWGSYGQRFEGASQTHRLELLEGALELQALEVPGAPAGGAVEEIEVGASLEAGHALVVKRESPAHVWEVSMERLAEQ